MPENVEVRDRRGLRVCFVSYKVLYLYNEGVAYTRAEALARIAEQRTTNLPVRYVNLDIDWELMLHNLTGESGCRLPKSSAQCVELKATLKDYLSRVGVESCLV
jgi:hypothetical protein